MTDRDKCMETAYAILARQQRTVVGLAEKLAAKGYDEALIKGVVEALIEYGFLNDVAFAESYISTNRMRHGIYRMRQALRRKGISDHDFDTALSQLEEEAEVDENAIIDALILKKCESIGLDRSLMLKDYAYKQKQMAKVMRFLAGRGFSPSAIREGLRRMLSLDSVDED